MASIPFQLWSEFEERFSQNGELPSGSTSNENIFRAIVKGNNARSSEALVIQGIGPGKADPLLALRAYIYRGQLKEAQALARQLVQGTDSSVRVGEVLLEQSRILGMNGDWSECENLCTTALELPEVAPVSQLTLFQIRALARFETQQMMAASGDLDRIDSLAAIFPNCPSAFYAAVLRAKITARDRSPEAGFQLLALLWSRLVADPNSNLDRVHALIRAELDLERLAGIISPAYLLASYRIAEITGERLYMALAALEGAFSGVPEIANHFEAAARDLARSFPKVQKLLDEIENRSKAPSVSGATLAHASKPPRILGSLELSNLAEKISSSSSLLLVKQGAVVHMNPFSFSTLEDQPQLKKALMALSEGPVSMSGFFSKIWGRQKYSSELHATLISSLLYRMKKKTGVHTRILDGSVRMEGVWVLP